MSAPPSGGQASPSPADKPATPAVVTKDAPANPVNPVAPIQTPHGTVVASQGSIGAFEGSPLKEGVKTLGFSVGSSGVVRKQDAPEIPKNVQWPAPVTVKKAEAPPPPGAGRAIFTFINPTIDEIKDADTLDVKTRTKGLEKFTCRLDTVNAPETAKPWKNDPGQPFGDAATKTLKDLIEHGKQVTVRVTQLPVEGRNYGRATCQVEVDGIQADEELLRKGMAWLYRRYAVRYPGEMQRLEPIEAKARSQKVGLWSQPNPEDPETYSHRMKQRQQ